VRLTINYPQDRGRVALRTAADWDRDHPACATGDTYAVFELDVPTTLELKPVLHVGDQVLWAKCANYVVTSHEPDRMLWPFFVGDEQGRVTEIREIEFEGVTRKVRVYVPPGYDDNTLRRFPVIYMQDGQNLFHRGESFMGGEWQVDETMDRLAQMNLIRKTIVVGIWPNDREKEYTRPGYEAYGRFIVECLKPQIDAELRTCADPENTVTMGSSLGGVAALHLAWTYPDVFGRVACLSSTFGVFDDLFERIARDDKRDIMIYMDSGWPKDNFSATNAMRDLLVDRGYRLGLDLLQFSFPEGAHSERSWAERIHVPFQFFFGRAWIAARNQAW
jgi:predicted alpha/beta superfamily hydrolase